MSRKLIFAAIAATALAASPGAAQDYTLAPFYGEVTLQAGFSPDPYVVSVTAGGGMNAAETIGQDALGGSCIGMVANAPDFRVHYTAGSYPLIFSVLSEGDTTLVINGPDGQWYCNDDGFGYPNPMIQFDFPQSGQYDIWVGAYSGGNPAATLYISELGPGPEPIPPGPIGPDANLNPTFGQVFLAAGFLPDPHQVNIVAGGPINAQDALGGNCIGTIAAAPDYRLDYAAGGFPLYFRFLSNGDTTLVILGPDGQWYCDDDGAGYPNPQVYFSKPLSGLYDIWVGDYGAGGNAQGTLQITEIAP